MTELDFNKIGGKIKERRQNLGITQEYIANELDVNPSHISNIECGRAHPSLTALVKIANILHCSVDYFIYDEYTFSNENRTDDFLDSKLQKKIESYSDEKKERLLKILDLLW